MPDITILDTRREIEPKFLLFDDNKFSIINKHSTKGYLQTIDKMNKAITYKIIGENLAERIVNNSDTIEIKFYDESEGFVQISKSN